MRRVFKVMAIGLGAVAVLLIVAAVALPLLFDPNDFRDELVQRVKGATGRDLQVEGDVGMSVFPWLGVEVGPMQLGNAPGFEGDTFASTQRVSIRIKLMPLLSYRLEADTVTVEGLELNLARDAKGVTNWADLAGEQGGRKGATGGSAAAGSGAKESGVSLAALSVRGVSVGAAKISWRDDQSDRALVLDNVTLKTGLVEQGKPVDVAFGMDLAAEALGLEGRIGATTTLTLDDAKLKLAPVELNASLAGKVVPGGKVDITVGVSGVDYDGKAHTAAFNALEVKVHNLALEADFKATGLDAVPVITGELNAAEFSLRKLLTALAVEVPVTADTKVLEKVAFSAELRAGPDNLALTDLKAVIDDSMLRGDFAVSAFAGPKLRFDLDLDQLDADRYLSPAAQSAPAGKTGTTDTRPANSVPAKSAEPDFTALRKLDAAGQFKLGRVRIANLESSQASVNIVAKDGLVRIHPVAARLYGGTYAGNISFDARRAVPVINVNESLTGILAEPLLEDLNGHDRLAGTGNVKARLTTTGLNPAAMKAALNGTVRFSFENGAVKGVNIARLIREAKAKLKGQLLAPGQQELQTDFSEMSGSIRFKNGVGHNNDFVAKSPLLRVNGRGSANLVAETIDYKVEATLVGTAKGQGGADLKELSGVAIPVRIGGTFADPTYGLDVAVLAKVLAKSKAAEIVVGDKAKIRDKLKKAGSGGLKSLLKGVLGN